MTNHVEIVPWASGLWQRLTEQQDQGRLPHALLLCGHQGMGKHAFARSLAQVLLCLQPVGGLACGHCKSCELLSSSTHPDLVHLCPEESGKAIKVDQVRDLTHFLHSTAQQGGYRVVIVDPAESMNVNAANALLKSLEEPGQRTLIMLISHQPGQLMPTIRSRCQRIDFPAPKHEHAVDWLVGRLSLPPEKAAQLLSIAQDAPLLAVKYQEEGLTSLRADLMKGLVDILKARATPLELADKLQKQDLLLITGWVYSVLVDIVRLQTASEAAKITNTDMEKMLSAVAKKADVAALFVLIDQLQAERVGLMERHNPNRQLLLETLFMRWNRLVR